MVFLGYPHLHNSKKRFVTTTFLVDVVDMIPTFRHYKDTHILYLFQAMYRRIVESQRGSKTKVDPEVTLQFLKSAIYYFLTDPENHQGHLNAIENILGFNETEKKNIRKARTS